MQAEEPRIVPGELGGNGRIWITNSSDEREGLVIYFFFYSEEQRGRIQFRDWVETFCAARWNQEKQTLDRTIAKIFNEYIREWDLDPEGPIGGRREPNLRRITTYNTLWEYIHDMHDDADRGRIALNGWPLERRKIWTMDYWNNNPVRKNTVTPVWFWSMLKVLHYRNSNCPKFVLDRDEIFGHTLIAGNQPGKCTVCRLDYPRVEYWGRWGIVGCYDEEKRITLCPGCSALFMHKCECCTSELCDIPVYHFGEKLERIFGVKSANKRD